jgi:hypothetical protein
MKSLGIVLIIIGLIWAIIAFNFDTSVSTGLDSYERVSNLGLMAERQNHLIFSGLSIITGILLFGFGTIANNSSEENIDKISCPFCAEKINVEAKLCRFCQKDLPIKVSVPVEDIKENTSSATIEPVIFKSCNKCRSLNSGSATNCILCNNPLAM